MAPIQHDNQTGFYGWMGYEWDFTQHEYQSSVGDADLFHISTIPASIIACMFSPNVVQCSSEASRAWRAGPRGGRDGSWSASVAAMANGADEQSGTEDEDDGPAARPFWLRSDSESEDSEEDNGLAKEEEQPYCATDDPAVKVLDEHVSKQRGGASHVNSPPRGGDDEQINAPVVPVGTAAVSPPSATSSGTDAVQLVDPCFEHPECDPAPDEQFDGVGTDVHAAKKLNVADNSSAVSPRTSGPADQADPPHSSKTECREGGSGRAKPAETPNTAVVIDLSQEDELMHPGTACASGFADEQKSKQGEAETAINLEATKGSVNGKPTASVSQSCAPADRAGGGEELPQQACRRADARLASTSSVAPWSMVPSPSSANEQSRDQTPGQGITPASARSTWQLGQPAIGGVLSLPVCVWLQVAAATRNSRAPSLKFDPCKTFGCASASHHVWTFTWPFSILLPCTDSLP
eukprot:6204953-Pleurochrysis_carterae.AAC.2